MQTVIFVDIDSTIVENRFSRKAIGQLLTEIADATGKTPRELGREMWQENSHRQKNDPDNVLTMDWDDIMNTVARRYDVALSDAVLTLWEKFAHIDDVEILDNAPDVLRQLRAPHRQLVIATKGLSKYQMPVLHVTGMTDLFDDILTPDRTGYLKTSPDYFAEYTGNGAGARFIQVGDHYYDDVICAKRNGFASILRAPIDELAHLNPFDRPQKLAAYTDQISTYPADGSDVLPDAVVVSLQELPRVIEQLETS